MMNIQGQIDQERMSGAALIENFCQCQVCYMTFNETTRIAQMLHCGHTFCMECIGNVQKYGNSAHLECPTCRSETKCALDAIPTNFLVMEMIRKFGLMGPPEAAQLREARRSRNAQRAPTIDEMVDEKYRQLIADVKGELMSKFEELREGLRESTLYSAETELEELSYSVMEAVRDAYDGLSDSDDDGDEDAEDDSQQNDGEDDILSISTMNSLNTGSGLFGPNGSESDSDGTSIYSVEHQRDSASPTPSIISIPNPMRSSNEDLSDVSISDIQNIVSDYDDEEDDDSDDSGDSEDSDDSGDSEDSDGSDDSEDFENTDDTGSMEWSSEDSD